MSDRPSGSAYKTNNSTEISVKAAKEALEAAESRRRASNDVRRHILAAAHSDFALNPSADNYSRLEDAMIAYQEDVKNRKLEDF